MISDAALRILNLSSSNLIEANERCAILHRKREICSSQLQKFKFLFGAVFKFKE
jgi:hypothetical protein